MKITLSALFSWRLHAVVLVLACLAEWIGIAKFDIGIGTMVLLPLLYAFVFATFFNPNIVSITKNVVGGAGNRVAAQWILIFLMPFIAKFAVGIGPKIHDIIAAGPSLLLQEIGNVATVLFAMPVAVLVFGMGREAIGATHSIAREPNIALIADRFGLKTPEGIGVMGVYVMGTLFGAIYFSIMPAIIASWNVFDVRALAMGCGVGSGSMMGACSAALTEILPEHKDDIVAFAASSNLLTYATGLFVSIFIALPFAQWLYRVLTKHRKHAAVQANDEFVSLSDNEEVVLSLGQTLIALVFAGVMMLVVNWVGTGTSPAESFLGMLILLVCCVIGVLIKNVVKLGVPSIAWVSVVAICFALPAMPMADNVIAATDKLGLLPLITPALAYAGLAISRAEVNLFKKSGIKIAIIALLTFTGTYVGSVVIADWFL
ncbi:hypothetical protein B0181_06575 [Moraxella caviae]|uniref:Protein of uncharacterized function (DUF3100) n=2 Tax=Moraxella caviae TaxID=34060 RepID=A0A1T0A1R5_9GAMM|nr:DUF3100 domain-containing protein [Moraxella caviae]OOR89627.1 hypothetical protein B0181_06575 [Moraxella caviae]STZ10315.1 Protein of uncharacterised function (DUF3100) [Moraxella caviae]VEW12643.1 Protein of uncharacterised function (DUF3100) [Moraxella caviae]